MRFRRFLTFVQLPLPATIAPRGPHQMELNHVLDREVEVLSGGELQRFAIGVVAVQKVSLLARDTDDGCRSVS